MQAHQPNTLEIRELEKDTFGVLYEFYVDGESLAQKLGISDRPRCMEFSSFDLDYIAVDKERFPQYDGMRNITNTVEAFVGIHEPSNQLGSGRVVLYRCHCGSDCCGVISFRLSVEDRLVRWSGIRYENDTLDKAYGTDDLVFYKEAYTRVFADYLEAVTRIASTLGDQSMPGRTVYEEKQKNWCIYRA